MVIMAKILGSYQNGNYNVSIYSDGTKIRETEGDYFDAQFPENIDIKITNYCDMNCPYCHENSSKIGKHGDILNQKFISTLQPYTELAIGGGNPLDHPYLEEFLFELQEKNIIANITVNQKHFEDNINLLQWMVYEKMIYGIGVSLTNVTDEFISKIKTFPNAVIHVINGIVSMSDLSQLYDNGLKVLILGYKTFRRGESYYCENVEFLKHELYEGLEEVIKHFDVVSFDNLALKQLNTKRLLSDKQWEEFYMGDDGQHTMYIDMVNRKFAKNSTSKNTHDLLENITDMFLKVKKE